MGVGLVYVKTLADNDGRKNVSQRRCRFKVNLLAIPKGGGKSEQLFEHDLWGVGTLLAMLTSSFSNFAGPLT
jgi:hypothetical protein